MFLRSDTYGAPAPSKNALIVEGGGMRGIFAAGVLDAFIRKSFDPFDICIGVSAGTGNIAGYLADMYQRSYNVYTDYTIRPESINWKRFLLGGHLLDLDWLWDITIREIRLDVKRIFSKRKEFLITVTDVQTGHPLYLKPDEKTLEPFMKASSALPILYRGFPLVGARPVTDGGISDPIPIIEAVRRGATQIMVLRSRASNYVKKKGLESLFMALFLRKYPKLKDASEKRAQTYMQSIAFINAPPEGITILEVTPPDTFKTGRLTRDFDVLTTDYHDSVEIGYTTIERWHRLMSPSAHTPKNGRTNNV